ncbi:HAD family hydrolase [Thiolinea disciformis]|uniref:HAD family hydrolase n=1 Tax=Thiolinea disciformis TaxID=125614 RepID=UPI00037D289D|nr:HAD family phosphatase [Thiolinea disciformis]
MLKAVLFDHDGTLVDSEATHYALWSKILAQYEKCLSESDYMVYYSGLPSHANAERLKREFLLVPSVTELVDMKLAYSRAFLEQQGFPLMAGAQQVLGYFYALGLPLAVVTGAGREEVEKSLAHHHLLSYFKTLVSCQDVERGKPFPDGYRLALARLGIKPEQALAFEDTEHGVNAAAAAGIPVIAIPNAMSERHDFAKASYVAVDWQDALARAKLIYPAM